ncbi:hypothetical protein T4C_8965 [Trichinella pseudospiralis]|uniref:Uncharacterized protein n=1 Tax=Trichinella pseudospiralis TaxID=6337 RepID=A0A0V1GMR1_TRIPS|nr:hypothetical protein T4C_8965 [Trichinella pseudospiralis]
MVSIPTNIAEINVFAELLQCISGASVSRKTQVN